MMSIHGNIGNHQEFSLTLEQYKPRAVILIHCAFSVSRSISSLPDNLADQNQRTSTIERLYQSTLAILSKKWSHTCLCCFRFGFITFESPEIAQSELERFGGPGGTVHIDGRDVKMNYAHTKEQKGELLCCART